MNNYLEQTISGAKAILSDYAARNKLLGKVDEYTDDDIRNSISITIDEINYGDVYHTAYTMETLYTANPYLMKMGVAKNAMYSKMVEKSRNSMPYSDGAGYVDKEGNLAAYQNMYSQLANKYEEIRVRFKASLNMRNAMV